mgnify:CR=1 FL=1
MPKLMPIQFPRPKDWQELQRICKGFYEGKYPNAMVQEFGHGGQAQQGVDVYVRSADGKELVGVACRLRKRLKPDEVAGEFAKSHEFAPPLTSFVMFTTAPRNTQAQSKAIELSNKGPYHCLVMSWDDIEDELRYMPETAIKLFEDFVIKKVHKIAGTTVDIDLLDGHLQLLIAKIGGSGSRSVERLFIANRRNKKCIEMDVSHDYRSDQLSKIMSPRKASQIARWLSSKRDLDAFLDGDGKDVTYWLEEPEDTG